MHFYTHLQIDRPYIAVNSETYISLRQQELRMYKKIGCEFYCEELFMVKHKSKYRCESALYFNLGSDMIKENCNFAYYFNKTDIKPIVLDGRNKVILANWPDDTHIVCKSNNDLPVKISSFLYDLGNRSVLCNCRIAAENNFLLKSLAACYDAESKLVMYFMVNITFEGLKIFSKTELKFCWDKLLPVSNMASSRSEENVNPSHFQHQMVSQCWIVLQFC